MHEHAGWRVVDGLHGRDKLGVVGSDDSCELGIEFPVAGETVEFVDDDVVDVGVLGKVLQHFLESLALHVRAGLAWVDEFLDDHGTERLCLLFVGFALRGNGETFFPAATFSLVRSGNADVGDGASRGEGLLQPGEEPGILNRWVRSS
nr:hypothetical protein [Arthrobacter woluwensis]